MPDLSEPIEAVIFDMDGVIVDSEPRHEAAFLRLFDDIGYLQTHGIHFPDYYGRSDQVLLEDFMARHNPPHTLEELLNRRHDHLLEILKSDEPIFDGLPELVQKCARLWPLAVASGSLHVVIDAVLAMKNLRQHFQVILSSQDVKHGKPAPDIFLRAADLLGKGPKRCVVIEDSEAGVTAGLAAGMQVIAITNSFSRERLGHATVVVDNYEDIERLLFSTRKGGIPAAK